VCAGRLRHPRRASPRVQDDLARWVIRHWCNHSAMRSRSTSFLTLVTRVTHTGSRYDRRSVDYRNQRGRHASTVNRESLPGDIRRRRA
jgi:hypothetical protein